MTFAPLSDADLEHFLTRGYVIIPQCFDRQLAADWIALSYRRMGCSPEDPNSWPAERIHLPSMHRVKVPEVAPRAWAAICQLMGGPQRINAEPSWGDSFIVNFNLGAAQEWTPPEKLRRGWHKDGDFFRHFLDNPERVKRQKKILAEQKQRLAAEGGGS